MRHIIFSIFVLIIMSCAPQHKGINDLSPKNQELSIDTTYFLLGTLSEYNGRFWIINKPNQVDRYNTYEKPLIDFQEHLINNRFKTKIEISIDSTSTTSEYETFSKELSSILNSFFTKGGGLPDSCFEKPDQIASYLLGRYFRYGRQANDSIFEIHLLNFPNHYICDNLLKRTGCKVYLKQINVMPAQFIYYFIPTPDLKGFFKAISDQKNRLDYSYDIYMQKLWGMKANEYNKTMTTLHEKELAEIISKF